MKLFATIAATVAVASAESWTPVNTGAARGYACLKDGLPAGASAKDCGIQASDYTKHCVPFADGQCAMSLADAEANCGAIDACAGVFCSPFYSDATRCLARSASELAFESIFTVAGVYNVLKPARVANVDDLAKVFEGPDAADLSFKCDTRNCANWECKEWCHCFDEKAEHYGLYEHRGCGSDGADVCKCKTSTFYPISEEDKMFVQKASTIPEVITVEGACGTSEEANGKYTQMEVTARGKNTWVNANTGYEIKFEAGSDWGAKELIKGDGWTIFGDLHHRYYIAADGDDSFFTPPHAEWTTRFPDNCAPTLKY